MPLPLELRRATLATHIVCSVGWLGAAAAYLALGVAAAVSRDLQIVRAAWIGMELTGWFVIVPLACLAFLTGLVLSLGTPWGLFRHYWVIIARQLGGDVVHPAVGLVVLVVVAVLNVHKPRGLTPYGQRKQADERGTKRRGVVRS
jgi:hypothetical protein